MAVKTASVWPVNSLGEIVVQLGTGDGTITGFLTQDQLPTDDSTNAIVIRLPSLDATVLAEPITGFVSGAGTVGATDTILQAIDKLDGNTNLKALNLLTGYVSGAGTVAATDTVLQGINKLNGNIAANTTSIALKANAANSALTGLTATQARTLAIREVSAAGAITMNATDDIILVNKTVGAATTVNLTAGTAGRRVQIKDKKADANTNNITLTANGAETIDGSATFVMNVNRQASTLVFSGTEWSLI